MFKKSVKFDLRNHPAAISHFPYPPFFPGVFYNKVAALGRIETEM